MKKSYYITLSQTDHPKHLSELLGDLEQALKQYDIDYVMIGAVARDFWMKYIHEYKPKRVTKDIDFALEVSRIDQFERLMNYLEGTGVFERRNKFSLIYKKKTQIDLAPFGGIENEEGYDVWMTGGKNFRPISTLGISEHWDLLIAFDESELDWRCGASVLGRHMRRIITENSVLEARITEILAKQSSPNSALASAMKIEDKNFQQRLDVIQEILLGLQDKNSPQ